MRGYEVGIIDMAEWALKQNIKNLDGEARREHQKELIDIINRMFDGAYAGYSGGGGEIIGFHWAGSLVFTVQEWRGSEDAGIVVVARPVAEPEPVPRAPEYQLFLTRGVDGTGPVEVLAPPFDSLVTLGEVLAEPMPYQEWFDTGDPGASVVGS